MLSAWDLLVTFHWSWVYLTLSSSWISLLSPEWQVRSSKTSSNKACSFFLISFVGKVVYFTAKTIQIKSCTTCSTHQLGIDVDQSEALHSPFFAILYDKSTEWKTYSSKAIFSAFEYRTGGSVYEPLHEISNNVVCATSKGSDQPAHTPSLISLC